MSGKINYVVSIEIEYPSELDDNPDFDDRVLEFRDDCVELAKDTFADFRGVTVKALDV